MKKAKGNLCKYFSVVGVLERFGETLVLIKSKFVCTKDFCYYPKLVNTNRPLINSLQQKGMDAIMEQNELDFEL